MAFLKKIFAWCFIYLLFIGSVSYGAFPIKDSKPVEEIARKSEISTPTAAYSTNQKHEIFSKRELPFEHHGGKPKKKWLAIVLAALAVFTGLVGIQRLYLGYTWQGVLQLSVSILSFLLNMLLLITLITGSIGALTGLLLLGIAYGFIWIWGIVDLVRIARGTLKPKNGYYEK